MQAFSDVEKCFFFLILVVKLPIQRVKKAFQCQREIGLAAR